MAYTPASNVSSAAYLAHLATVFYEKKALSKLQTKFIFNTLTTKSSVSTGVGKTIQFYRYTNLGANTTPKTPEGSVGSPIAMPPSKTVSITLSQYTDFLTVSDFLAKTAIDPIIQNAAEALGFRAGLTLDNLTKATFDTYSSSTNQALLGTYLKAADFRNSRSQLQGVNVQYFEGGTFRAIAHPYVTFDLQNDPSINGLADTYKYTNPKMTTLVEMEDRGTVATIGGCTVMESTNVTKIAGTPNKWRVYVVGYEAIGSADLAGSGPSYIEDPSKQRFKINTHMGGNGGIWDPEGVIGAAVAYNFFFGTAVLEGPTGIGGQFRYRTIDAPSSIVA